MGVRLVKEEHAIASDGKIWLTIYYESDRRKCVPTANNSVCFHCMDKVNWSVLILGTSQLWTLQGANCIGSDSRAFNGGALLSNQLNKKIHTNSPFRSLETDQVTVFTGKKKPRKDRSRNKSTKVCTERTENAEDSRFIYSAVATSSNLVQLMWAKQELHCKGMADARKLSMSLLAIAKELPTVVLLQEQTWVLLINMFLSL